MWNEATRKRFQELREKELEDNLALEEREELSNLFQQLDEEEAGYLAPATQRLKGECLRLDEQYNALEAQNKALESLFQRRERLIQKLESVLQEVQSERKAIQSELSRIVGEKQIGLGAGR